MAEPRSALVAADQLANSGLSVHCTLSRRRCFTAIFFSSSRNSGFLSGGTSACEVVATGQTSIGFGAVDLIGKN